MEFNNDPPEEKQTVTARWDMAILFCFLFTDS